MAIPGFSGQASLYISAQRYATLAAAAPLAPAGASPIQHCNTLALTQCVTDAKSRWNCSALPSLPLQPVVECQSQLSTALRGCVAQGSSCPVGTTCSLDVGSFFASPHSGAACCPPDSRYCTRSLPNPVSLGGDFEESCITCPPGFYVDTTNCGCESLGLPCSALNCQGPQFECCSGECVNLLDDVQNCGACGVACTGRRTCESGTCECPAGTQDCSGICVNLLSDNSNCGQCGNQCTGIKTCVGGICVCPLGWTDCNGICYNLTNNPLNCGGCGAGANPPNPENICLGSQLCCNSTCTDVGTTDNCRTCGDECSDDQVCCLATGGCTDLSAFQTDDNNCGACGNAVGTGQKCCNGVATDLNTLANCLACGDECSDGQACCLATGGCTDLSAFQTDDNNCGACGNAVGIGQKCCNGVATNLNTLANCTHCGDACSPGQSCCPGGVGCKNLSSDPNNCGKCGRTCIYWGTLGGCENGNCTCPQGSTCCANCAADQSCCEPGWSCCPDGRCCQPGSVCTDGNCPCLSSVNYQNDLYNCGSCGNVCPTNCPPNSSPNCTNGQCECACHYESCGGQCCAYGQCNCGTGTTGCCKGSVNADGGCQC